ncbi:hypothetical protein [Nocardia tengchongensis]|uniref:hypothetical protein n=1 Tax=Nocardia tengchongensis TaxID=2055889 RepID=UPI0036CC1FF5
MSSVPALQQAMDIMDRELGMLARIPTMLGQAIDTALQPAAPGGSPDQIRAQSRLYVTAGQPWSNATQDLLGVATADLPAAWRGKASLSAVQAMTALQGETTTVDGGFTAAVGALQTWADQLAYVQSSDEQGRTQLQQARALLLQAIRASSTTSVPLTTLTPILEMAATACHDRLIAAKNFDSGASDAANTLMQWALQARAHQISTPGIDPLVRLSMATTGPKVLSSNALTRASQQLAGLSATDRSTFEALISEAGSPQEAAYLWKALAAGYSLLDVQSFGKLIHGHDPTWLSQHLKPDIDNPNLDSSATGRQWWADYQGSQIVEIGPDAGASVYGQGLVEDCVGAAAVVARANADPVFMLGLTTGQGPAAVAGANAGEEGAAALHNRLQRAYGITEASTGGNPIGSAQTRAELYSKALGPSTGSEYRTQSVTDKASRQAVMPQIETALSSGKPVPFAVAGNPGHAMVMIGVDGDQLEVYNPWGVTEWVTKQQFIDGQIGALTSVDNGDSTAGELPVPDEVELPK